MGTRFASSSFRVDNPKFWVNDYLNASGNDYLCVCNGYILIYVLNRMREIR